MIQRLLLGEVLDRLETAPAVVLLGPRQAGKTTLALQVADRMPSTYLDLESEQDLAKLSDPRLFLEGKSGILVILDEVQRLPGIFAQLRGVIDSNRQRGVRSGQFLLLGSASIGLLRQSGESLAGRVSYLELPPFTALEVPAESLDLLWVRGGFPESFLARSSSASLRWRRDFIRTYLERDVPALGPRIPAETLRRLWTMLAHQQGGLLNLSQLGGSLALSGTTVTRYVDLLVDLLLVRRLIPWSGNVRKRLVRTPKVYIRDSGLVHALLGIESLDALLSHPVAGASWEGFVLENLLAVAPAEAQVSYYRTSAGAEIDLVIEWTNGASWAVEIKRNLAPKPSRGFYEGMSDVNAARGFVVYPGSETYPLDPRVSVVSIPAACEMLRTASSSWK